MTHPLLTNDQDPPGEWERGWLGGGYVSYRRPVDDTTYKYVVVELSGEHGDGVESRAAEVWTGKVPKDRPPLNHADAGETIDTGTGLSEGAAIALEYMEADAE